MTLQVQSIFVVLPTYNERENIVEMVPTLFGLGIPNLSVLVVDDSSPDGTGRSVEALKKKYPNLFLLTRTNKEGLGRAYVSGFQEALHRGADVIIQMDSDFSHDPQDVLRFLEGLQEVDLVIGSRYIQGGKTKNWSLFRLFLSKFANIYARFVTKTPVFDLTGGFKAWRSSCMRQIEIETLQTNGYGFQIETTFRAFQKGFKIKEIPILFAERREGKSKMGREIVWEALWLVWRLRFDR